MSAPPAERPEQDSGSDLLLALDTSGSLGSIAIGQGGQVRACVTLTRDAGHASGLIPAIDEALAQADLTLDDLRGIVVGEGPGSFTGVRVAAATTKGLARAVGLPVWPVSSLAGAALTVDEGTVRYALFDARASRVYGACYRLSANGLVTEIDTHAGDLSDVLDGELDPATVFVGDAAEKHTDRIAAAGYSVARPATGADGLPRTIAEGLLLYLAHSGPIAPLADPGAWQPEYVRAASAERLWKP